MAWCVVVPPDGLGHRDVQNSNTKHDEQEVGDERPEDPR